MSKHSKKIIDAFKSGLINSYLADKLEKAIQDKDADTLVDMALDDAAIATNFGVENEYDYNINYYLNHLLDSIIDDTFDIELSKKEKEDLKKYLFSNRNNPKYNLSNFTDWRILINNWLHNNSLQKNSYPNIGVGIYNRTPSYNLDKWIEALKNVYTTIKTGNIDKATAMNAIIADWEPNEQYNFLQWVKFYEDQNNMKYNIKTANMLMPSAWMTPEQRVSDSTQMTSFQAKKQDDKEKSVNKRRQMRSRISSIRKLLGEYSDLNPVSHEHVTEILDMLSKLEARVMSLQSEAMVKSCIVKTAKIIESRGFVKDAAELYKIADEPVAIPTSTTTETGEQSRPSSNSSGTEAIIQKLEEISKFLKNRQIVRELASTDLSLDSLGIASYFPEIGDSQSKLIESFGYASNKVESVIAKLRGTGGSEIALQKDVTEKAKKLQDKEMEDINKSKEVVQPQQPNQEQKPKTEDLMNKPVGEVKNQLPG